MRYEIDYRKTGAKEEVEKLLDSWIASVKKENHMSYPVTLKMILSYIMGRKLNSMDGSVIGHIASIIKDMNSKCLERLGMAKS